MDWLFEHSESILMLLGAILTFTSWNISQGLRLKTIEKEFTHFKEKEFSEYRASVAEQFKVQQSEVASVRAQQEALIKPLYEELRRIGEKLAHIEGFLTARKQAARK